MRLRNFLLEDDGVTAIEYGLVASLIAVAIIAGVSITGTSVKSLFDQVANCVGLAMKGQLC